MGDEDATDHGLYLYEDEDVLAGEMAAALAREEQALVVLADELALHERRVAVLILDRLA